ncbi:MAG: hypothetical protein KC912_25765, partial [Proteobacteria bacterium]|nr:hypothetical protein [Pseudomonadota bacterium]
MFALLATLGLALAQTSPTSGVELNSQLWRPTIDGTPTLWANDAHKRPMLYGGAKFVVSYVHRPFVYTYGNGAEVAMVNDAVQADAIGSLSLGPVRIGVDVPVFMLATSDVADGGAGLGDLVVDVKGTLLEPSTAPIGIAVATRVALPTGNTGVALSDPGLGWEIEGIFDKPIGDVRLLLNVGTRMRPTVELDNATLDDQIYGRLGLGWFLSENVGLSADVGGQANYSDKLTNAAAVPVEGILGGWARIPETPVVLRAGGGTGLVNGVGAPASRFIFTVSYEPPEVRDRDLDGLVDRIDECPSD